MFSNALLRYSKRVVRKERLLLLNSPLEVVAEEDALIEKAEKELTQSDLANCKSAIESEIISVITNSFESTNCGNCEGYYGVGNCEVAQKFQHLLRKTENQENNDEATDSIFDDTSLGYHFKNDAHKTCADYKVNDRLFNQMIDPVNDLINNVSKKYEIDKQRVELEIKSRLNNFVNNALETPPGVIH